MVERPPRRVVGGVTHTWQSQAIQYERGDVPRLWGGITHWECPSNEVPVPIHCLLAWDFSTPTPQLVGILNYFPEGAVFGEEPHDFLIIVHPLMRRTGVGRALVQEALTRWPEIDLMKQCYTDAGWELARSILDAP